MGEYGDALQKSRKAIEDVLRRGNITERGKMKVIVDELLSNEQFAVYQDTSRLVEHLSSKMLLIGVTFPELDVQTFGVVNKAVENGAISVPTISLREVIKTQEDANGAKFKLQWVFVSDEAYEASADSLKVKWAVEEAKNDDDDWQVLEKPDIKQQSQNAYVLEVADYFESGKTYRFQVHHVTTKPLAMAISSNVVTIELGFKIDFSKEVSIPLKIHSHKGNHLGYGPE